MVVDIQGIEGLFTDPQIHSLIPQGENIFGNGDLGAKVCCYFKIFMAFYCWHFFLDVMMQRDGHAGWCRHF